MRSSSSEAEDICEYEIKLEPCSDEEENCDPLSTELAPVDTKHQVSECRESKGKDAIGNIRLVSLEELKKKPADVQPKLQAPSVLVGLLSSASPQNDIKCQRKLSTKEDVRQNGVNSNSEEERIKLVNHIDIIKNEPPDVEPPKKSIKGPQKVNEKIRTNFRELRGKKRKLVEEEMRENGINSEEDDKRYTCLRCGYLTQKDDELRDHMTTWHPDGPQKPGLERKKIFVCPICDAVFPIMSMLMKHKLQHSAVKKYACDKCDFRTGKTNALARHVLVHAVEKPGDEEPNNDFMKNPKNNTGTQITVDNDSNTGANT